MVDAEKLQRIKEQIDAQKQEQQQHDVGQIIKKLKAKEPQPPPSVSRISSLLKRDQTTSAALGGEETMNFSKASVPKTQGLVGLIGSFFTSFEGILSKVASSMSVLPMTQNMRALLDSGGIKIGVETYLALCASAAVLSGLIMFLLFLLLGLALEDDLLTILSIPLGFTAFIGAAFFALSYPKIKAGQRSGEVDKALPFALRQLATQVKAGVSFQKALSSIATSNYGVLSEEFGRVAQELNSGETMDAALNKLSQRTQSRGLKRTITQVNRSFKTGGNLSKIISDIAEDVSFETRMSIRDFTEKLNFINIIYIMVAVVAPVMVAILSAILQIPMFAGSVPDYFIYVAFAGIFATILGIVFVMKKMEPTAW